MGARTVSTTQELFNLRSHPQQVVVSTDYGGDREPCGLYCVDNRARLRWRVGRHRLFPGKLFLAPVRKDDTRPYRAGAVQLGGSTIVVRWP